MSQDKRTQRVTRYTVNKPEDTSSSQGVPTSVRPTEVRPDSNPVTKFGGDVVAGVVNVGKAFVNPNRSEEEYQAWATGDELRDKPLLDVGIGTLSGAYTPKEGWGEADRRLKEEPGKIVGEVALEAGLVFIPGSKVQKASKITSDILKAKLGASAIKAADGPTRAEAIHANKMAKFNKSVGDVNKLNREVDAAATKVRDEDVIIQGNVSYSKTPNPMEPRTHVDMYYQRINEGGPPEVNVGGGFKDPAQAIGGFGKSMDEVSIKSLRGSGQGDKMFKAAQFNINKQEKAEAFKAFTSVKEENLLKEDTWIADAENKLLKSYKQSKYSGLGKEKKKSFLDSWEFMKGDKFLTGVGGGLGIFGLGGRKNDKSN